MIRSILVIEDDDNSKTVLLKILKGDGYDTIEARNGIDGLNKIYRERPDLVILDIMMPYIDGIEILKIIKKSEGIRNIPIIVISAVDDEEIIRTILSYGVSDYILKPARKDLILSRIEKIFKNSKKDTQDCEIKTDPFLSGKGGYISPFYPNGNKKILIADNSFLIIERLREALKVEYSVTSATNGVEAIVCAIEEIPNLILIDISLPILDAVEVARKLSAIDVTKDIKLIVMVLKGQEPDKETLANWRFSDYITKPINPGRALAKIRTLAPSESFSVTRKNSTIILSFPPVYSRGLFKSIGNKILQEVSQGADKFILNFRALDNIPLEEDGAEELKALIENLIDMELRIILVALSRSIYKYLVEIYDGKHLEICDTIPEAVRKIKEAERSGEPSYPIIYKNK